MSVYTDARSTPGKAPGGSDERELFMENFLQDLLEAWKETNDFESHTYTRTISKGKADVFPIIGRKRDAEEHVPGELILGGSINHNEVTITLDNILVDSAFIAEIDELIAHYPLASPYARQLAESLSTTYDKRIATLHVLASRLVGGPANDIGHPDPSYAYHANMATDPAQLEAAHFAAVEYIRTNDISGQGIRSFLPWQQYLLLSRYAELDERETTGNSNRGSATAGPVAGINITATNHIPKTNVTTGLEKYRGNFTTTVGFISTPMAVGTLNRRGLRAVMKPQEDRLGTLLIASKFTGHGILRPECSFELATAVRA